MHGIYTSHIRLMASPINQTPCTYSHKKVPNQKGGYYFYITGINKKKSVFHENRFFP